MSGVNIMLRFCAAILAAALISAPTWALGQTDQQVKVPVCGAADMTACAGDQPGALAISGDASNFGDCSSGGGTLDPGGDATPCLLNLEGNRVALLPLNMIYIKFPICGDLDTVDNNTVFYGPETTRIQAQSGMPCDITEVGSTGTVILEDEIPFTGRRTALFGMYCLTTTAVTSGATVQVYRGGTLQTGYTCTIPAGGTSCISNWGSPVGFSTTHALGIGVTSTDTIGANDFRCEFNSVIYD